MSEHLIVNSRLRDEPYTVEFTGDFLTTLKEVAQEGDVFIVDRGML